MLYSSIFIRIFWQIHDNRIFWQVSIPGLCPSTSQPSQLNNPTPPSQQQLQQQPSTLKQFTPTKLSTSHEVAKEIAAEYVLQLLREEGGESPKQDHNNNSDSPIENSHIYLETPPTVNTLPMANGIHSHYVENEKVHHYTNFALTNGGFTGVHHPTPPDVYASY